MLKHLIKLYRVYEMRLGINLLEPWEKIVANGMLLSLIFSFAYAMYSSLSKHYVRY